MSAPLAEPFRKLKIDDSHPKKAFTGGQEIRRMLFFIVKEQYLLNSCPSCKSSFGRPSLAEAHRPEPNLRKK
jgi:hypothetical protein